MSKPAVYLFPDTNVFMHFRRFDEIDWSGLVGGAPVVLCLARIVTWELDKHKTEHRNQKKRERAKAVLSKVRAQPAGSAIRTDVTLHVLVDYPDRSAAPARLDLNRPDDTLIASAREFKERCACDVRVVSDDTGVLLAAPTYGLGALEPPESARLPPEPDEHEAQLRKTQAELVRLQSKRPRLVLAFKGETNVLGVKQTPHALQPDMLRRMAVGRELAKDRVRGRETTDGYERLMREFVDASQEFLRLSAITAVIALELANRGDGPADDIHVSIAFPEGIVVTDVELKQPTRPKPGDEHRSMFAGMTMPGPLFSAAELDPSWTFEPGRAEFQVTRIVQKKSAVFPALYVRRRDGSTLESCALKAHVVVAEPPDEYEFELSLKVEA